MNISINLLLYTFAKSPCIHARQLCHLTHARWDLQSHFTSIQDNFATSHPHKMTKLSCMDTSWLWVDVTSAMSKVQMMNISINFPLYTFAKSPHVDTRQLCHLAHARWNLQSHLKSMQDNFTTLCPCKMQSCLTWMQGDFCVVKGQLDTQCKVDMRWEWPCQVRFTKSPGMDVRWMVMWGTSYLVKFFTPWYLSHVITVSTNQNAINLQILWENERFYQKIFPLK